MTAPLPALAVIDEDQTEFTFDQLSPHAKDRARERYREHGLPENWSEAVIEDAVTIAAMLGIEVDNARHTVAGGTSYTYPAIWFSLSYCQGDGASFDGNWKPVASPIAALNEVMAHAPADERLQWIALDILELAERCNGRVPHATATIHAGVRYFNSGNARVSLDLPDPDGFEDWNEFQWMAWNAVLAREGLDFEPFERELTASLRAFMDWIYSQLRDEHEHLTSDDTADEILSDLLFDEDGYEI